MAVNYTIACKTEVKEYHHNIAIITIVFDSVYGQITHKVIQSTCNSHSNHLQRWIGSICIQCESAQCTFRVDAINSNQCANVILQAHIYLSIRQLDMFFSILFTLDSNYPIIVYNIIIKLVQ